MTTIECPNYDAHLALHRFSRDIFRWMRGQKNTTTSSMIESYLWYFNQPHHAKIRKKDYQAYSIDCGKFLGKVESVLSNNEINEEFKRHFRLYWDVKGNIIANLINTLGSEEVWPLKRHELHDEFRNGDWKIRSFVATCLKNVTLNLNDFDTVSMELTTEFIKYCLVGVTTYQDHTIPKSLIDTAKWTFDSFEYVSCNFQKQYRELFLDDASYKKEKELWGVANEYLTFMVTFFSDLLKSIFSDSNKDVYIKNKQWGKLINVFNHLMQYGENATFPQIYMQTKSYDAITAFHDNVKSLLDDNPHHQILICYDKALGETIPLTKPN